MTDESATDLGRLHLRFGWWALTLFAVLGVYLESLHGFKVEWYLDVGTETRRLMWRLAHAHGAFLSIIHVVFGHTLLALGRASRFHRLASRALMAAAVLVPGGFFLGGVVIYGGDPGLGIVLLPLGALCLLAGLALVALGLDRD